MNDDRIDRLYELLPVVYRQRDAEQGEPLKALLRVIAEQVMLVEDDIARMYENWFIETCEDWVVPYIGDLVGYTPVHEAGEPADVRTPQGRLRNKILIPRREVANTISYRRRKGTLALLELLSHDVAGWPARAVEFYPRLGWTQALNHLRPERGRRVDVRDMDALEKLNGPFCDLAHTVDVRRIDSRHTRGKYNIPSVGLYLWPLKVYPVTKTPAYCEKTSPPHCFSFSVLGNDTPLYVRPEPEPEQTHIAEELNLPIPITRRLLQRRKGDLYGEGKSLQVWVGRKLRGKIVPQPVPLEQIVPTDLSGWQYVPKRGQVALDPALGRIAFASPRVVNNGVWVSYHYGFGMDLGGGEYERELRQPKGSKIYRVGVDAPFATLRKALEQWQKDKPRHGVIEITASGVHVEQLNIAFQEGQESLQLRAANRTRPILRLLDWQTDRPDSLLVSGSGANRFVLDGIVVAGQGMQIDGDMAEVTIRHSTLVPGWTVDENCETQSPTEPSIEVFSPRVCVTIDHSIVGAIQVSPNLSEPEEGVPVPLPEEAETLLDEATLMRCRGIGAKVRLDPIRICINDSIVDATDPEREAIGAPGCLVAHARVAIHRTTVIGQVQVHTIDLGENAIFHGRVTVARRQQGCLRFCYVTPGSRTPRRYRCQPDLVEQQVERKMREEAGDTPVADEALAAAKNLERLRVRPRFISVRYGTPAYCQLAIDCADEIRTGADDASEMGVYHDLFQPQRWANLRVRLNEYLPAGMDIGMMIAS